MTTVKFFLFINKLKLISIKTIVKICKRSIRKSDGAFFPITIIPIIKDSLSSKNIKIKVKSIQISKNFPLGSSQHTLLKYIFATSHMKTIGYCALFQHTSIQVK